MMIVLNASYKLENSADNTTHQLSVKGIRGAAEYLTVRGFTKEEVLRHFCGKGCRLIEGASIVVNPETGAFHITKEEDGNVYIIFHEYFHACLKEKSESRISLKDPLRIVEGRGNVNSSRDTLKYFVIPKTVPFWIVEKKGEFGKDITSFIWDGHHFSVKENMDIGEIEIPKAEMRNIITLAPEKNLFVTDSTCTIEMFLRTYPDMYFRFLYEDFMDSIETKYENFERVVIVDIDEEDNIESQILKKAKNKRPLYICIPMYDYSSYHAVYEAISIKEY